MLYIGTWAAGQAKMRPYLDEVPNEDMPRELSR